MEWMQPFCAALCACCALCRRRPKHPLIAANNNIPALLRWPAFPTSCSSRIVLEAGDTLYLPKGVVHFAEGTGELSVHATIGIRRKGSTWFDLVYDAIVKKYQHSKSSDTIMHPDLIENMVQSTQLGLRLAQLVPVGEVDRLYTRSSSRPQEVDQEELLHPLEELLLFYMDEMVDAVLFHATSLSIMPQPNPTIYGRGYLEGSVLQHLIDTHFCPDADPEFDNDPTVAFELPIADRIASLQVSNSPKNFLSLARESRPQRAACHVRDTFGNHDDADHNDHRHRDARASSSDFNLAMMSNGRGTNVRAKRKDTADENPCDGTEFAANSGYRQKRGYTNHGIYHCDGGCDSSCNIVGSNCDSSCESDCECNAGYAYPHHQSQSAAAAGCAANPCNGRDRYQAAGDLYPCADARTGCNYGKYWKDASITAAGTCTNVDFGYFTTNYYSNQLVGDVQAHRPACNNNLEFQSQAPTAYQNRVCTAYIHCSAGSYVTSEPTATKNRECEACSKGQYSLSVDAKECTACYGSRTTPGAGANSRAACTFPACSFGHFRNLKSPTITPAGATLHAGATVVDSEASRSDNAADDTCVLCPETTYNNNGFAFQCTACPKDAAGISWDSPKGSRYVSNCVPAPCNRGTWRPNDYAACAPCPSGQTTKLPGAKSQSLCYEPKMKFFVSSHRAYFVALTPAEFEFDCVHVTIQLYVRILFIFWFTCF